MQLIIMAGGLGSRFGGLKQLQPINKHDETIIDLSISDAIKAGFEEVVFVINPKDKPAFEKTIFSRLAGKIPYSLAFQNPPLTSPKNRTKPWGTAHALFSAFPYITQDFAVINADDYYGSDAFKKAAFLLNNIDNAHGGLIAYKLKNTFSGSGKYKRGICKTENGFLKAIEECEVQKVKGKFEGISLVANKKEVYSGNEQTSMNFWCFSKDIKPLFTAEFEKQYALALTTNPQTGEVFLPSIIESLITKHNLFIKVLTSNDKTLGLTYKEDLALFKL